MHAERGFRFLKDPEFLAASLYLKKPERIMALLMVMTVCLLVYAALEYRIRQALHEHDATFPNQKGKRRKIQRPGGYFIILWDSSPHSQAVADVLNLTDEHCNLLKLLENVYDFMGKITRRGR